MGVDSKKPTHKSNLTKLPYAQSRHIRNESIIDDQAPFAKRDAKDRWRDALVYVTVIWTSNKATAATAVEHGDVVVEGNAVMHPTRGMGRIERVDRKSQKPFIVRYHTGDVHKCPPPSANIPYSSIINN